ncbi:MAG: histidinol-phosphatase HisJ family protein [Selenomonadaceae bacterium]|nr:histidinol-phosphatase HisJ family protein [Selenomonadaceae bacterium]
MKFDYHMHFEYGDYDERWVQGFFDAAAQRGLDEIGISEHSHTFPEFEQLYYDDLTLDGSTVGRFQTSWLKKNKFKHTLDDYFAFMGRLKSAHKVKTGIEVCNFKDQDAVKKILERWAFDYVIGSVHFLNGWGFDASALVDEFARHDLRALYERYTIEVERLAASGLYDVLGHPFNIWVFNVLPTFDATEYYERAAKALSTANMAIDINTGTRYRYPIKKISPPPEFMEAAARHGLPIITSSDAHQPEDCGRYIDEAIDYARGFGYSTCLRFTRRQREEVPLG